MLDQTCKYCTKGDDLTSIMIPICNVDGFPLYLFRNQSYRGRTILAYDDHVSKIAYMDEAICARFYLAVRKVCIAIEKAFAPGQTNVGMYADTVTHLHCHIVPKYEGGLDWSKTFQMNPQPEVLLTEAEYAGMIDQIKAALNG